MVKPKLQTAKGLLNRKAGQAKFQLLRYLPSDDLSFFVQHYWIGRWDLRGGAPYLAENIPYPCVNLVFERGNTHIYGVVSGKSTRRLEGKGQVLGVKFRPGGFYPFVHAPLSELTDEAIPLEAVFPVDSRALETAILADEDDARMVALAEDLLRGQHPEPDDNITLINQVVDCITDDRTITRVDDVVSRLGVSKRTLQRLFSQYVGVSPKWVIQRYRLHEAAEQLANGGVDDWARLAAELGYFDQAHFIKDFKAMIGQTPGEYARNIELNAQP